MHRQDIAMPSPLYLTAFPIEDPMSAAGATLASPPRTR